MSRDKDKIVRDVIGLFKRIVYKPIIDDSLSQTEQADVWESYFQALETYGEYGRAAKEVGYNPKEVIDFRRNNPSFQSYCDTSINNHSDALIGEAGRRATEGTPRFALGGKSRDKLYQVAIDYSDSLLLILLKRRVKTFNETQKIEVTSDVNAVEMFDYMSYSPQARAKLRELMVILKADKESASKSGV